MLIASESRQSRFCKKWYFYSFCSTFKLVILSHHKFEFLHLDVNLKHKVGRGVFRWKTVDFGCCIKILTFRNFHTKSFPITCFHDNQTHPHVWSVCTGFISSVKVSIKNFLVIETFQWKFCPFQSSYWNFDGPIFRKMLFTTIQFDSEILNSP